MRATALLMALAAAASVAGCANEVVVQNPTTPDAFGPSVSSSRRSAPAASSGEPTGPSAPVSAGSPSPAVTVSSPRPGPGTVGSVSSRSPASTVAPAMVRDEVDLTFGEVAASTAVERDVAAVWRRYWAIRAAAYATNDVDDEALRAVASGAALDQIVSDVSVNRVAGKRLVGRIVVAAPALAVTRTRAEVTTCVTADARLVRDDGSTVDRLADLKPQIATLELTGTTWRMVAVVERVDVDCS